MHHAVGWPYCQLDWIAKTLPVEFQTASVQYEKSGSKRSAVVQLRIHEKAATQQLSAQPSTAESVLISINSNVITRTNSSQILTGKEGATFLSRSFKLRKVQQRRTSHSSCTRCFSYNNAVIEGCVTHPITQRAAICSLATCRSNQCLWQQEMSE